MQPDHISRQRHCERCGAVFIATITQIKKGYGKYCNMQCYRNRVERECERCGKSFEIKAGEAAKGRGRFCSKECYWASRRKERPARVPKPSVRIQFTCPQCGTDFLQYPSNVKSGARPFCSRQCRIDYRKVHPYTRGSIVERFWERVGKSDGCWEWTGYRAPAGYGQLGRGPRNEGLALAHRLSWEFHYGPIPDGLLVCHRCDNPPCVRPDHLFLGTFVDNAQDMVSKGRHRNKYSRDRVSIVNAV